MLVKSQDFQLCAVSYRNGASTLTTSSCRSYLTLSACAHVVDLVSKVTKSWAKRVVATTFSWPQNSDSLRLRFPEMATAAPNAPLSAEPARPEEREQNNLPPMSYAAVVEKAPADTTSGEDASVHRPNGPSSVNGNHPAGDESKPKGHMASVLRIVDTGSEKTSEPAKQMQEDERVQTEGLKQGSKKEQDDQTSHGKPTDKEGDEHRSVEHKGSENVLKDEQKNVSQGKPKEEREDQEERVKDDPKVEDKATADTSPRPPIDRQESKHEYAATVIDNFLLCVALSELTHNTGPG